MYMETRKKESKSTIVKDEPSGSYSHSSSSVSSSSNSSHVRSLSPVPSSSSQLSVSSPLASSSLAVTNRVEEATQLQRWSGLVSQFNTEHKQAHLSYINDKVSKLTGKQSLSQQEINTLVMLAGVKDSDVYQAILRRLYDLSSHPLGNLPALLGLTQIILLYENKQQWMDDTKYEAILTIFAEKIKPDMHCLIALNLFLEAALAADVNGADKQKTDALLNKLLDIVSGKKRSDISLSLQAAVAYQALRRVGSDESKSDLRLRKGIAFVLGVKHFAMAAGAALLVPVSGVSAVLTFTNTIEGIEQFSEAFHMKPMQEKWYDKAMLFKQLLMGAMLFLVKSKKENDETYSDQLYNLLDKLFKQIEEPKKVKGKYAQAFVCDLLTDLLLTYSGDTVAERHFQRKVLSVLGKLSENRKSTHKREYARNKLSYLSNQEELSERLRHAISNSLSPSAMIIEPLDKQQQHGAGVAIPSKHTPWQTRGMSPPPLAMSQHEQDRGSSPQVLLMPETLPIPSAPPPEEEDIDLNERTTSPPSLKGKEKEGKKKKHKKKREEASSSDEEMVEEARRERKSAQELGGGSGLFGAEPSKKAEKQEKKEKRRKKRTKRSDSDSHEAEHPQSQSSSTGQQPSLFKIEGKGNKGNFIAENLEYGGEDNEVNAVQGKMLSEEKVENLAEKMFGLDGPK